MVDRMQPRPHSSLHAARLHKCRRQFRICQTRHAMRVIHFGTNRSAIFAVQRHVKNASAKLFGHIRLQLQTFFHPRFDTAVMIANR